MKEIKENIDQDLAQNQFIDTTFQKIQNLTQETAGFKDFEPILKAITLDFDVVFHHLSPDENGFATLEYNGTKNPLDIIRKTSQVKN